MTFHLCFTPDRANLLLNQSDPKVFVTKHPMQDEDGFVRLNFEFGNYISLPEIAFFFYRLGSLASIDLAKAKTTDILNMQYD